MWKHPKYYKELRLRNKPAGMGRALSVDPEAGSDQVISPRVATASARRAPGPGLKPQASTKLVNACIDQSEPQAPSNKLQAASSKQQA